MSQKVGLFHSYIYLNSSQDPSQCLFLFLRKNLKFRFYKEFIHPCSHVSYFTHSLVSHSHLESGSSAIITETNFMEIPGQVPISNTEVIGVNLIPNIPGLHFIGPQSDHDGKLLYCLTMSRKNRKRFWVCQEFWLKICMDLPPTFLRVLVIAVLVLVLMDP